jgi:muconolactone delta-isomerase
MEIGLPDYTEELDLAVAGDLDPDVLLKGWLEELDLGVEVPGSVAANARMTIRARKRASTIRNVNTSVFDIDAFDNMEDLLLKMADGL